MESSDGLEYHFPFTIGSATMKLLRKSRRGLSIDSISASSSMVLNSPYLSRYFIISSIWSLFIPGIRYRSSGFSVFMFRGEDSSSHRCS